MDSLSLQFLPFPYVFRGHREDGMTHAWLERCGSCDRQCEASDSLDIEQCSYGVNYMRVDDDLLIAGIVLREDDHPSAARSKMLKKVGREVVPRTDLAAVASRAKELRAMVGKDIERGKAEILAEYRESAGYKDDIVQLLQPSLQQTFAQVHDYRSLVSQIVQNVNVILQSSSPGKELDEQLDEADPALQSIYWSARLMEFKIDSALYLAYPERVTDPQKVRSFRFHGAVKKYLSIYAPVIEQRRLVLRDHGGSYGSLMANPDAVGVIPHAFLDNAIKYAPDGSPIDLTYIESDSSITLKVKSYGPRITREDHSHLFDLFYRGAGAKESGEDGTGFGLGLAQHVASRIGAALSVTQDQTSRFDTGFETTFIAIFRKPGPGDRVPTLARARVRTRGGVA
jgi:signal transduction histidine kinase